MFPMDILSINFFMVFITMSSLSFEYHDVDGYASSWCLLSPRLNLGFNFLDAIMCTSTSTTLLIIVSRFADILSLNNMEKSFSKESTYRNCTTPGGDLNFVWIELYTFKKCAENSHTVSSGAFFMLLYCVSNCKGFFLSPHLSRNIASNAVKPQMLEGGRDLNHFLIYPERLCVKNLIFSSMQSTSSRSLKSLNQSKCL
jgi:hypothetical protein